MALTDIKVPDIGDFSEVGVIEVLVQVGDTIKVEQSLLTVESDKASMEIPSSHAGVVKEIKVALGDKVKEGSVIVVLETADAAPAPAAAAPAPVAAAPAPVAAAPVAAAPVASVASAPAASSTVDLKIPDIGDFKDVAVIEMLVKVGDTVAVEQSLFTVESDKASMEIPSPSAGTITALSIKLGDTVNIGDVVGQITVRGAAPAAAPVQAAAPAAAPAQAAALWLLLLLPPPPWHLLLWLLLRTIPPWLPRVSCPTHHLRCASSLVNWAFLWQKSRVQATRAASRQKISSPSPSR